MLFSNFFWKTYQPYDGDQTQIVILPRDSLGGYVWKQNYLASEGNFYLIVHEMLHWWTNLRTPAWFREGIHSYMAWKLMIQFDLVDQASLFQYLQSCLKRHKEIVRKTGKLDTLATSSLNFDQKKGGDDIYNLMPILAYKLDKEIRAQNPRCSIDEVFSSVCKNRHNEIDILFLIKEISGYDPNPLFKKYFYSKAKKPEELLK